MKRNNRLGSALALYAMLALALLMMALLGAQLYAEATASQRHNEQLRATLAYVQSRVAAADTADGVAIAQGPEGQALVLQTANSKFEVRIYCYEAHLVEETALSGSAFAPEKAQRIAECESFTLSSPAAGVLSISADDCAATAALRSGEGDAL